MFVVYTRASLWNEASSLSVVTYLFYVLNAIKIEHGVICGFPRPPSFSAFPSSATQVALGKYSLHELVQLVYCC